jgi:hypothetical protein
MRIYQEMIFQRASYEQISIRSGISVPTLKGWRSRNEPELCNLIAVGESLGLTLKWKESPQKEMREFFEVFKSKRDTHKFVETRKRNGNW